VSENARLAQSTPVIRRAIALLDDTLQALAAPERWCQGAWARDAAGKPIDGAIIDAIRAKEVASRCNLAELVAQGLARGHRIEIASDREQVQAPTKVTRAPASWMLAADTLAHTALWVLREKHLWPKEPTPEGEPRLRSIRRGERVLAPILVSELGTHADVTWCLVVAGETLRLELDRRAAQEQQ
jgi:hypothetical protein